MAGTLTRMPVCFGAGPFTQVCPWESGPGAGEEARADTNVNTDSWWSLSSLTQCAEFSGRLEGRGQTCVFGRQNPLFQQILKGIYKPKS